MSDNDNGETANESQSTGKESSTATEPNSTESEYIKASRKFQEEEDEQRKIFDTKLAEKRTMLMQSVMGEDVSKIKARCQAESFRQKKNIDEEVEKLSKSMRDQFVLQAEQMRTELRGKIEKMIENKKQKLEQDKQRLSSMLDSELEAKRKLMENETERLKHVTNIAQSDIDHRDRVKKIMVDYKNFPGTKTLVDEFGLKRYQVVINKQSIWAGKTCIIYRGQFQQQSCYVKIVVLSDRSVRYKQHIPESTKIRQFLCRTNEQQQQLQHEAFVRVYDVFITDQKIYTFMDDCDSQNLMLRARKGFLSLDELRKHMRKILSCLEYMHQRAFAHLKIRGESIVFDNNNNVKLVGFGNAAAYFDSNTEKFLKLPQLESKHRLLDNHFPPEVFVDSFDPQLADVYSFGLLIYMMANFISNKKFTREDWKQWTIIKLDSITDEKTRELVETTTMLDIEKRFAPKVTLQQIEDEFGNKNQLTWKLKITDNGGGYAIRGRQLQLYCNISANPLVLATDIRWYKDSMLITDDDRIIVNNKTNNSGDEIVTTSSTSSSSNNRTPDGNNGGAGGGGGYIKFTHNGTRLLITKVTDEWQGFYQCIAQNSLGTGFSNQFKVQILCKYNESFFLQIHY
ncbi:phosphoenolpyruvate carboxylase kinase-like protein [Dermatophagoides farinae]|uniref:Phosphoenolpyruvate carboxylase kinase-like protein n=1 Tax=Dermatophagoides farinae TaxID=6954 RepID=A0A9D4SGG7_DERFA|nr:phosphoenolpyruvate carboxylase kinase-like protein [Dermatophagoides farinae]